MKYYICGRKKWICGVSADSGIKLGELYRKISGLIQKYTPKIPLVRSNIILGDIISRVHLPE